MDVRSLALHLSSYRCSILQPINEKNRLIMHFQV